MSRGGKRLRWAESFVDTCASWSRNADYSNGSPARGCRQCIDGRLLGVKEAALVGNASDMVRRMELATVRYKRTELAGGSEERDDGSHGESCWMAYFLFPVLGGGPALAAPPPRARLGPSRPLARRQNFGLASSASKKSSHACKLQPQRPPREPLPREPPRASPS